MSGRAEGFANSAVTLKSTPGAVPWTRCTAPFMAEGAGISFRCMVRGYASSSPSLADSETIKMLQMIPEFQEAEKNLNIGSPNGNSLFSASQSLFHVLDICENSVGAEHPMTAHVISQLLNTLSRIFSQYDTEPRLINETTSLIERLGAPGKPSASTLADVNAMAYLALSLGLLSTAVSSLEAVPATLLSSPQRNGFDIATATYHNLRGTALTLSGSEVSAISSYQDGLDTLSRGGTRDCLPIVGAQLHHNLGCCQAYVVKDTDAALDTWRKGLELLRSVDDETNSSSASSGGGKFFEAELLCNIGQIEINTLEPSIRESGITNLALALEAIGEEFEAGHPRTARVLSLLARGHHLDGKAVSSEGLYRSALGALEGPVASQHPSLVRERISTLRGYAALLEDWEQREKDSRNQAALADELESQVSQATEGTRKEAFPLSMCLPNLVWDE